MNDIKQLFELLRYVARPDQYGAIDALEAQQEIISKLPVTADGVPVVPGMRVWPPVLIEDDPGAHVVGLVYRINDGAPSNYFGASDLDQEEVEECYSTREAAQQAAQSAGPRNYEPHGMKFHDHASGRDMMLVYPTEPREELRGWILYKHSDGQWVTLRKATDEDRCAVSEAVAAAHHADDAESSQET